MDFNPLAPEFRRDPYPVYRKLRDEAPLGEVPNFGMFYIARHADVLAAFKQPHAMSSAGMREMMTGGSNGLMGTDSAEPGLSDADNLITSDPPVHDRLRNIVNRGFTPRQISELEPRIREIAEEQVDGVLARGGTMDFVDDLTIPLPVRVIAELLGVAPERYRDFKRWSDSMLTTSTGTGGFEDPERLEADRLELNAFLADVIAERRASPRDDLLSTIISGGPTGQGLTDAEAQSFAVLLLLAGNETTTNLLGNAMNSLLAHPDQLRKVGDNPELIPAALEETLRFEGPVQFLFRKATEDVELSGGTVPAGRFAMLMLGSANRDESVFDDAESFDVTRTPKAHLGFGFGVHFCLGASLARLEARVTLETLFAHCTDFEKQFDEVDWIESLLVRGPKQMPLSFRAR